MVNEMLVAQVQTFQSVRGVGESKKNEENGFLFRTNIPKPNAESERSV